MRRGVKRHSAEFKARAETAALSGEKTLAELSAEFGVHPTMISGWQHELVKVRRAGCTRRQCAGGRGRGEGDRRSAPEDRTAAGRARFSYRAARHLPIAEGGDDCAKSGAVHKPAMHAARGCEQQAFITGRSPSVQRNSIFSSGSTAFSSTHRSTAAAGCRWRRCRGFRSAVDASGG